MEHYNAGAWSLYRNDEIDKHQRRLMEDHLAVCGKCLQSYLDSTAEQDICLAELLLPADFNTAVRERIRREKQLACKKRRTRSLVNYTVAASITLALMMSGIFDLCARELPVILAETGQLSRALERTARWDTESIFKNAWTGLVKLREKKEE